MVRDLTDSDVERCRRAVSELPRDGLPNYFDDQRFGSVGFGGQFIAEAWLSGDHERALRLAIAEPNPSDRPGTKAEKAVLQECWGKWAEAKARLDRSHARSLVTYLVDHPTDFRGAFARLRRELRSLYFSAFQSHLWNLMLGHSIEAGTRADQRFVHEFKLANLPIHRGLEADQAAHFATLKIPLPSARNVIEDDSLRATAENVLKPFGLSWEDLRVRHLKDLFLSKGSRAGLFFVEGLRHDVEADAYHRGRKASRLAFELPKGAYATMVVKRLTDAAQ